MRNREYMSEITTSSAISSIVKPFGKMRRRFPSTLTGIVDKLKRHKKRLAKRFSKEISSPNPPVY